MNNKNLILCLSVMILSLGGCDNIENQSNNNNYQSDCSLENVSLTDVMDRVVAKIGFSDALPISNDDIYNNDGDGC